MRTLLLVALLFFVSIHAHADVDTIKIGDTTYRLDGIDGPEFDQNCINELGELYHCGQVAVEALNTFIDKRPIYCDDLGPDPKYPHRRIGRCQVDGTDLNRWLVKEGWAISFEPHARGRYTDDEREGREGHLGIWSGCFVAPRDFRYAKKYTAALLGTECPPDALARLFPIDPHMPPGCEIKGKYAGRALFSGHRGIYHVPGCGSYRRTARVDRWFCSEEDAWAAGFRSSLTCGLR